MAEPRFDALMPPEMAARAEETGVRKAALPFVPAFLLAVLAGAFIALGAVFSTAVSAGGGGLPYGVLRLLMGLAFSLGLVLVVVGGAELFTGNNLVVMAWAGRKVTGRALLRNWGIAYAGNFAGAVATAALVAASGQHAFGSGAVGEAALRIAAFKCGHGFVQAVALGMLCNALVCLAVWLTYGGRSVVDKIAAILMPITAFVAAGFEHSVANMYFIPYGLFVKTVDPGFAARAAAAVPGLERLTWEAFFARNLLPVTIGNVIGGAVMVGAVYWAVYLRRPAGERSRVPAGGRPAPEPAPERGDGAGGGISG